MLSLLKKSGNLFQEESTIKEMITKNELKILFTDEQLGDLAKIVGDYLVSNSIGLEQKNDRRYLNKKQTCDYLMISNNTLDSWIRQGLPIIKIGKSIRFDKNAVDTWIKTIAKTD